MTSEADTEELLGRAAAGDAAAGMTLLVRHRPRLKRTVKVRIDDRLAARLDESDIVQETLAEAATRLMELRHTEACVEVFLAGRRVASHVRSEQRGRFTTQAEHMPASHRQHAEWTPSRVVQWASSVGPACAQLVEELMKRRPHPQQGFRSALGLIRLADKEKYGTQRVEKACARALRHRAFSYKAVTTLDLQRRNVLEYFTDLLSAHRRGLPLPSLPPFTTSAQAAPPA